MSACVLAKILLSGTARHQFSFPKGKQVRANVFLCHVFPKVCMLLGAGFPDSGEGRLLWVKQGVIHFPYNPPPHTPTYRNHKRAQYFVQYNNGNIHYQAGRGSAITGGTVRFVHCLALAARCPTPLLGDSWIRSHNLDSMYPEGLIVQIFISFGAKKSIINDGE